MIAVLLLASWFSITATRPINSKDIERPMVFLPPVERDVSLLLSCLPNEDRRIRSDAAWALGDSEISAVNPKLAGRLPLESNDWVRADLVHAMGRLPGQTDPVAAVTTLRDDDPAVRIRALWTLGQWRANHAVAAVAERAAKDTVESVRIAAAVTLGKLEGDKAEAALASALKDTSPRVREASARSLGELPKVHEEGLKPLLAALQDHDPLVRAAAVESLGRIDNFPVQDPVAEMGGDEYSLVRKQVAVALRRLHSTGHLQTTLGLLNDADMSVRIEATGTLASFGDSAAIPPLLAHLDDPDTFVRRAAAKALLDLKKPEEIVPPLMEQLQNRSERARREAAWALGEYRDKRATIPLTVTANDPDPETSINAIEALGKIADNHAVEALVAQLKNKMPAKRAMAAWSLGEIRDKRATGPLIPVFTDPDLAPRVQAVTAAGKINDEPFVLPLIAVLRNVSMEVFETRAAAAWSLGQIGDGRAIPRLRQMVSDRVIPTAFGPVYDHDSTRMNSAIAITRIVRGVANAGQLPGQTAFLTEQFQTAADLSDPLKECIGECLHFLTGQEYKFKRHEPGHKQYFVRSLNQNE